MPLHWTISHSKRLVVAVAKGEMRPGAMVDFLAALDAADARPYGKLVFLELVTTSEKRRRADHDYRPGLSYL